MIKDLERNKILQGEENVTLDKKLKRGLMDDEQALEKFKDIEKDKELEKCNKQVRKKSVAKKYKKKNKLNKIPWGKVVTILI